MPRMRTTLLLTAAALAAALPGRRGTAAAQFVATVDGGATHVRYEGADGGLAVFSLTPGVQWTSDATAASASVTGSQFEAGGWGLQGGASAARFQRLGGLFGGSAQGELAGAGAVATNDAAATTAIGLAQGRLHWLVPTAGLWVGAGAGRANDGIQIHRLLTMEAGGWARLGPAVVLASVTPQRVGDSLRWADAEIGARLVRGAFEVTASAGWRTWKRPGDAAASTWAGATGLFWITEHLAVTASGGRYPTDWAQGVPGGRYATLSLRFATARPGAGRVRLETRERTLPGSRPVVPEFEVRRAAGGGREVRVRAPDARRVEIMGDFTDWRPVALAPVRGQAGRWRVVLPIAPGTHRMNLRVDDGAWGVPPGLPALGDDFGGVVGILTVQ